MDGGQWSRKAQVRLSLQSRDTSTYMPFGSESDGRFIRLLGFDWYDHKMGPCSVRVEQTQIAFVETGELLTFW